MSDTDTSDALVSQSDAQGRVLSGVGEMSEQLAERIEQRAPAKPDAKPAETPAAPPVEAKAVEPAPTRGQKRFSELTHEIKQRDEALAKERSDREALEARLREIEAKRETPAEPAAKAEPAKPAAPQKAKFPTFEEAVERAVAAGQEPPTWYDYDDAKHEWRLQQREGETTKQLEQRIKQELAAERESAAFDAKVDASFERARKAYPDFDTVRQGPGGKIPMGQRPEQTASRTQFIFEHAQSEHLLHAIMKDVDLAKRLQQSDDVTFGVIIAGLIPAEKPSRPAWTPPPAPAPMVGTSSPTTPMPSGEMAKKGDFEGYREKRAAERGVKPRFR